MRECGGCTACCEGWLGSKIVGMRPGVPCRHQSQSGCSIYDERPHNPCVTFRCVWLQDSTGLDDSMRPDKCGAIIRESTWKNWSKLAIVPAGVKIPDATLERIRQYADQRGLPYSWGERAEDFRNDDAVKMLAAGPDEFVAQVKWDFSDEDFFELK